MSQPTPMPPAGQVPAGGPDSAPAPVGLVPPEPKAAGTPEVPVEADPTAIARLKREAQSLRSQLRKTEQERDTLRTAGLTEAEQAVAKAREEGATAWRDRYMSTVRANEALKILSAKGVVGAELALGALDLSDVDVDTDTGRADAASIEAKIVDLLARFPMLIGSSTPQGPSLPVATGVDQRRVTGAAGVVANDRDKLNESLRWALKQHS